MELSLKEIQVIKEYFSNQPVLKAFLFGSYGRKSADNNSDVDILVELDYSQHIGFGFVSIKDGLEKKLHRKVDLVSSNAVSKYILPFINKDKQLIYERGNG
ncbi:MAG: nucleotidyltransferase domain-containing protein [Bacteroidota bacterium]